MELRRTVSVKLDVTADQAEQLHETIEEFLWAANYVVDAACDGSWVETSSSVLHEETYEEVREQTRLHSNQVQSARIRAADALEGVVARWSNGQPASLPTFTSRFCDYTHRNATFRPDAVSLATVDGRITVDYILPEEESNTPHSKYLTSDTWETTGGTLLKRRGDYYLHVRKKADVSDPTPHENGMVLGVDLGVENVAVTSTGTFWSGAELSHWRREYADRRKSLEKCGSRSAKENVKAVGRTETGRCRQYLHRVANGLIDEALDNDCTVIAFEELAHIRNRLPRSKAIHEWAFRRLYEYVSYKAAELGITVEQVDPTNTSCRCSACGFVHETNRHGDSFECGFCGYENHADYNAAKNIGYRLLRNQTGGEGGAPVGVRLNTGMLNAKGVEPLPDSARAGVRGECHDA